MAAWAKTNTAIVLDPLTGGDAAALAGAALEAVRADLAAGRPFLVYSTAPPERVAEIQRARGRDAAATRVEDAFAILARELVTRGVDA